MKLRLSIASFLFMLLLGGACFAKEDCPERIVSLSPSMAEGLYLMGAGDKLVGCTIYCERPPEIKMKEMIGTGLEVNVEKVASLKPDLVIAISLTSPKIIEKFRNLGMQVKVFSTPEDFRGICDHFLELGRMVGRAAEAENVVTDADSRLALIREKVKGLPEPRVLVQVGARPLFVATGRYFINDFIELGGGINVAKEAGEGIYSREQALREDPDVIIIVTMGIVGEEERAIWKRYDTLSAAKNNRIFIIDSYDFCNPTPVSFIDTLEKIVDMLHFQHKKGEIS